MAAPRAPTRSGRTAGRPTRTNVGVTGPAYNKDGGVPLGDSGIWIADYTTEPENGGLGVFAHEFGHDLGLPDLYDTAGGDNGTGFWTLMSAGSWLNHGTDSIGTTPGYMGPWEKLQLGWLDYKVANYGEDTSVKLNPADLASKTGSAQALVVPLPERTVVTEHNTPRTGTGEWWSGLGNDLNATLSRSIDLTGKTSASVSAYLQGDLEVDYDYLYAEVSTNGGTSWTQVGTPIDGEFADWTLQSWDLSAFVGENIQFRFRVATDGGVASEAFLDDISVTVDGTRRRTAPRVAPGRGPRVVASPSSTAPRRVRSRTCTSPRTVSTAATTPR